MSEDPECSGNPTRKPDGDDASSALLTWPVYTCRFLGLWRLMIHTSVYTHAGTLQCSSMQCATNQPAFKAGKDDQPSVFREYNMEEPILYGKPESLLVCSRCPIRRYSIMFTSSPSGSCILQSRAQF